MKCEPNSLTCRLDEIAQALREPTAVEMLMLLVAAMSAVGTLLIAGFNVWLLWQQHSLAKRLREDARLAKRNRYASALKDLALTVLRDRVAGIDKNLVGETEVLDKIARLNEEIDDSSLPRPATWVLQTVFDSELAVGDAKRFSDLLTLVIAELDSWVLDPSKVPDSRAGEAGLNA